MTIAIYRCYPIRFDNESSQPEEHLFSVVTTEESATYAAPFHKGLDQKRIDMIIDMCKQSDIELPTTPEGWVGLALDNMSHVTAVAIDASEYDNVEDAVSDEIAEAEGAYYIREDEEKLNKEALALLTKEPTKGEE